MNEPTIFTLILASLLLAGAAAGVRMLRARRGIAAEKRGDGLRLKAAEEWSQLLIAGSADDATGTPCLAVSQMAASALHFPEMESLTGNPLDAEALRVFTAELERRRQQYPREHNRGVVGSLSGSLGDLGEDRITCARQAVLDAEASYESLWSLDHRALDVASRLLDAREDTEKTSLDAEYGGLKAEAILDGTVACVRASVNARQAMLALHLDPSDRAGLCGFDEVISNTVDHFRSEWAGTLGSFVSLFSAGQRSVKEEQVAFWLNSVRMWPSPRWSAYPLLEGEVLFAHVRPDLALSNYLLVRITKGPLRMHVLPLSFVTSIREVRHEGTRCHEFHFADAPALCVPSVPEVGLGDLERILRDDVARELPPGVADRLKALMPS